MKEEGSAISIDDTGHIKPSDVDQLREEFSSEGWRISTIWASASSGPDKRRLAASRDGVLLTAWSRWELVEKIRRERREPGAAHH